MHRFFVVVWLVQSITASNLPFDYFAAINSCHDGFPKIKGFERMAGNQDTYKQCKEQDPFCQFFCWMKAAGRIRYQDFNTDGISLVPFYYIWENPLEYEYYMWTGVDTEETPLPQSVAEKFKRKEGTLIKELLEEMYHGVEKKVSECTAHPVQEHSQNLTTKIDNLDVGEWRYEMFNQEDKTAIQKYSDCLENAWKTCGL